MVLYRRNRIAGGTYFFTVTLMNRRSALLTDRIDDLRCAYQQARRQKPFETVAVVVLPDHLHAVWTLPDGDTDYSGRWRLIKNRFSRSLLRAGVVGAGQRSEKGEVWLWQRRFWEHTIQDDADLRRHIDYLYFNPVKHGLVRHVADWPYSSFHRFVARGELSHDWGGVSVTTDGGDWGE